MQIDPLMVIVVVGTLMTLLVERIFYYRSKYRKKNNKPENPSHGERIATLEEAVDNQEKNNEKDHRLIREDIRKLGGRIDRIKK